MLLMVVGSMLEPHPSRPQLGLQSMYDARQGVRLPQQPHLTQQVLINGAAGYQGQHLAGHSKRLVCISTVILGFRV